MLALAALAPVSAANYPMPGEVAGDIAAHDPSMVATADGYALFSTRDRIELRTSPDRVRFDRAGSAFAEVPPWVYDYNAEGDVWAPDVSFHGGQHWMYYAASEFGSNRSAIGVATSATAAPGTWQDHGIVHTSEPGQDYNAIDNVVGPGGQSVLGDNDGDLLVCHCYGADDGGAHKLGLNLLEWGQQGWPSAR